MSEPPSGLIYRDAISVRSQASYVEHLLADLAGAPAAAPANAQAALTRALLSASTLECALADVGDVAAAAEVQVVTDAIAGALLQPPPSAGQGDRRPLLGRDGDGWAELAARMAALRDDRPLRSSRPEGFAYYALEPGRFAREATSFLPGDAPVTVLGVRTAGVALSSVTAALFSRRGRPSERLTVRPQGHPFDRRLALDGRQLQLLTRAARAGHDFLVVDEGPGLSGSSFLAVGEALLAAGIPAGRIAFFGTRAVDPATLVAPDGARRWQPFRYGCALPGDGWLKPGEQDLSGGRWRAVLAIGEPWPATWPSVERLKALREDGELLRKFEGLGRLGAAVHRRAVSLAQARLGPVPVGPPSSDGFINYRFVAGRPLTRADGSARCCREIGRYIAARPRLCPVDHLEPSGQAALTEALLTNVSLVLGRPFTFLGSAPLQVVRPAIVDGHMAPHEWISSDELGGLTKVDGASHGDDHFFPGPTDVAWDLAGTIVEWDLGPSEREALLQAYQEAAGDDPRERLRAYLLAYASFRARLAALAARSGDADEAERWRVLERHYNDVVHREVAVAGL